MFKIELCFDSNENGIFTSWTETADSEQFMRIKVERMLDHWLKILCPYVDSSKFFVPGDKVMHFKYLLIQNQIQYLNSLNNDNDCDREFEIVVYQGENMHNLQDIHLFRQN
jgi:hypothetical protein